LLGLTLDGDEIAVEGEVVWVAEPVRARRLSIRPCHGTGWAQQGKPDRLPATYTRTHGVR
jgi:hypothetical protein